MDSWLNAEISLFKRVGDKVIYLPYTQMDKISWIDLKKARSRLTGLMPLSKVLLDIENEDTIEVLWNKFEPLGWYREESVMYRLENIRVLRKYMLNLSPNSPDLLEVVQIHVSFYGRLVISN